MAYQTGTATSTANLLDTARAFLAANGWTVTWRFQVAQVTWRWLHVTKSGLFFNLWEQLSAFHSPGSPPPHNIFGAYATGYTAANDAGNQPGQGAATGATGITPPYLAYHFFEGVGASGPYFFCALEIGAGEFRHFGIGILNKIGTYTGGEFSCGVCIDLRSPAIRAVDNGSNGTMFDDHSVLFSGMPLPGTDIRCIEALSGSRVESRANAAAGFRLKCGNTGVAATAYGNLNHGGGAWLLDRFAGPIVALQVAPLIRPLCFAERTTNVFSLIGDPPAFRFVKMTFLSPGDEVVLGSETWKCFPVVRKGSVAADFAQSGDFGYAYLKN